MASDAHKWTLKPFESPEDDDSTSHLVMDSDGEIVRVFTVGEVNLAEGYVIFENDDRPLPSDMKGIRFELCNMLSSCDQVDRVIRDSIAYNYSHIRDNIPTILTMFLSMRRSQELVQRYGEQLKLARLKLGIPEIPDPEFNNTIGSSFCAHAVKAVGRRWGLLTHWWVQTPEEKDKDTTDLVKSHLEEMHNNFSHFVREWPEKAFPRSKWYELVKLELAAAMPVDQVDVAPVDSITETRVTANEASAIPRHWVSIIQDLRDRFAREDRRFSEREFSIAHGNIEGVNSCLQLMESIGVIGEKKPGYLVVKTGPFSATLPMVDDARDINPMIMAHSYLKGLDNPEPQTAGAIVTIQTSTADGTPPEAGEVEHPKARADSDNPLPFGVKIDDDDSRRISRFTPGTGREVSIFVKNDDQWALVKLALRKGGTLTKNEVHSLLPTSGNRGNTVSRLRDALQEIQLTIAYEAGTGFVIKEFQG